MKKKIIVKQGKEILKGKHLITLSLASFFLFSLTSFISASIVFTPEDIFKGYRILNIGGNESIYFNGNVSLIGNGNVLKIIPSFEDNLTRKECQSTNDSLDCLSWQNKTYFQPNQLKYKDNQGLEKFINKFGNQFQYTIPLTLFLKWIKFGLETITIVGDTTYNSTNTNVTSETGFAHLNVSNSSIIGYFPFDDNVSNTTVYDYTDGSSDGFATNGAVYNTSGVYGGAFQFDGKNDFVNISTLLANNLAGTSSGTISFWVQSDDYTPATAKTMISAGVTTGNSFLLIDLTASTIRGFMRIGGSNKWQISVSTTSLTDRTWHHVVLVQNASSPRLYLDGVAPTQTFAASADNTSWFDDVIFNNARFGDRSFNSGGEEMFFNGSMDEVMFWNTALNSTEVLAIYNNQTARFFPTGTMNFEDIDFTEGGSDLDVIQGGLINITLNNCQTNMGSSLRGRINNGTYQTFSGCNLTDYSYPDNNDVGNLSVQFIGGNGSVANTFYSPLILRNITLTSNFSSIILYSTVAFIYPNTNLTTPHIKLGEHLIFK